MTAGQPPDYEKQAKEAIQAVWAQDQTVDPAKAAQITTSHIAHAARLSKDSRKAIVDVTKGALAGMLLTNQDLPETALQILKSLMNISLVTRADPSEIMNWVLEGIAEVTPSAGMATRSAIHNKIEAEFMGTGQTFSQLCDKALAKSQTPS